MNVYKHEELYQVLLDEIGTVLPPHAPLPSERELVERFGVSRATVRHAVGRLQEEGRVYRTRGAGTFVADPELISKSPALTSFTEDMVDRRLTPGSKMLELRRCEASVDVAADLNVSPGTDVHRVYRLRLADGMPMCLEEVWLRADQIDSAEQVELTGSLYELLDQKGLRPHRADQTIAATVVDSEQAELLEVAPYSPALRVSRVTCDLAGTPIERAESLYRADRYAFRLAVTRRSS